MIEANRLSAPGERAALERVEQIAERLDELPVERLVPARHTIAAPEEHARLVEELEVEAARCGRTEILEDVRERVRTAVRMRLSAPSRYDPVGRYPLNPSRAEDAALIEMTLVDAAAVAVVEDRLDPEVASRLASPGRALLGLPPVGLVREAKEGPAPGEPTADEWVEAARGDARPGDYEPIPVGLRVGLATMAAVILAPAAIFVGVGAGNTLMGILGGIAVVAVCWLVATYKVRD